MLRELAELCVSSTTSHKFYQAEFRLRASGSTCLRGVMAENPCLGEKIADSLGPTRRWSALSRGAILGKGIRTGQNYK
jgi:hypothetical protein